MGKRENNDRPGLSCTILYIPSIYLICIQYVYTPFPSNQKTQKYLVEWGGGGMLRCCIQLWHVTWPLAAYFCPWAAGQDTFLHFPHHASFPILRYPPKIYSVWGGGTILYGNDVNVWIALMNPWAVACHNLNLSLILFLRVCLLFCLPYR